MPLVAKTLSTMHDAANHAGDLEAEDGDHRDRCVAQSMFADHQALRQALGPRGAQIVLARERPAWHFG